MKNLKILGLIILLLLSTKVISAKDFGIKIGPNFTFIGPWDSTNNLSIDSGSGFCLGAFYSFDLSKRISFQTEMFYSLKKTKYYRSLQNYNDFFSVEWKMSFIDLHLLMNYKVIEKIKLDFGFSFGPFISYNLNANSDISFLGDKSSESLKDNVYKWDYGLSLGFFLNIKMGKGNLHFDMRFSAGFANLIKNMYTLGYGEDFEKTQSAGISVLIGYSF